MSKFIISNYRDHSRVREDVKSSGFPITGEWDAGDIRFSVFGKLSIANVNFVAKPNGFVSVVGTAIYDGVIGSQCLDAIWVNRNGVGDIRRHLAGNYAVVILRDGQLTVFGEQSYAYDIFYYLHEDQWIVSNDLSLIKSFDSSIQISEDNLLEFVYLNGVIGNESIFSDVYRLSGEQILQTDSNSFLHVETINVQWVQPYSSFEKSVKKTSEALVYTSDAIKKAGLSVSVSMTGGLDSRTSLSSLLSSGIKPTLCYGVGNGEITNTHSRDREIVQLFCGKFGLEFKQMDWTTPTPISKYWNDYINKYGYLALAYQSSDTLMKSYENNPADLVTFGYGGELLRNIWVTKGKSFTIEEFVDEYYFNKNAAKHYLSNLSSDFTAFRQRIIEKFTKVCIRFGINPNSINAEQETLLLWEYRANADSVMLNLCNRMRYSCLLIFQADVLSNAVIPVEKKGSSKFMLEIMHHLQPEVLSIPFFSHQTDMVFSKTRRELRYPTSIRIRKFIGRFMPISFKRCLVSVIGKRKLNSKSERTFELPEEIKAHLGKRYDVLFVKPSDDLRPLILHSMCNYIDDVCNGGNV